MDKRIIVIQRTLDTLNSPEIAGIVEGEMFYVKERGATYSRQNNEIVKITETATLEAVAKTSVMSGDTYVIDLDAYTRKIALVAFNTKLRFIASAGNVARPFVQFNGYSTKYSIVRNDGTSIKTGDIPTNSLIELIFDGASFRLTNISVVPENSDLTQASLALVNERADQVLKAANAVTQAAASAEEGANKVLELSQASVNNFENALRLTSLINNGVKRYPTLTLLQADSPESRVVAEDATTRNLWFWDTTRWYSLNAKLDDIVSSISIINQMLIGSGKTFTGVDGKTYKTWKGIIDATEMVRGNFAFETKALATAAIAAGSVPNDSMVTITNETANNGLWRNTSGTLTRSEYDPERYVDNMMAQSLTLAQLQTLRIHELAPHGFSYVTSGNVRSFYQTGLAEGLGWPTLEDLGYTSSTLASMSSGVLIFTSRKSVLYQTMTFTALGKVFSRQGTLSSEQKFSEVGLAVAKKEVNKHFEDIYSNVDLRSVTEPGIYAMSSSTFSNGITSGNLSYPPLAKTGGAVILVVSTSKNNASALETDRYVEQMIISSSEVWFTTFRKSTGAVSTAWKNILTGNYVANSQVTATTDLNTITDSGVYGANSPALTGGIKAGNLNWPTADVMPASGGGVIIVGRHGGFTYQTIVGHTNGYIVTRQQLADMSWTPWKRSMGYLPATLEEFKQLVLDTVGGTVGSGGSSKNPLIMSYGSSSWNYMKPDFQAMSTYFGADYVHDSIGGQIIETMSAHQGSNPILVSFPDGYIGANGETVSVIVQHKYATPGLSATNSFYCTLSNGVYGQINFSTNTFKTTKNLVEKYATLGNVYEADFGFRQYERDALFLLGIGKNNLSNGKCTAQSIFEGTVRMTDWIKEKGSNRFIVGGHFINTGATAAMKQKVRDCNNMLKAYYGELYIDIQEYIESAQVWTDLNITPTADDLVKQAAGELPISLRRDAGHLSAVLYTQWMEFVKARIEKLGLMKSYYR